MRDYGQIQSSFWTDPDIQKLSDQGKLLAVYLLTGPHSNGLGCYRLPVGYVCADFGWSAETVSKAFQELSITPSQDGLLMRCERTEFVFLPKFLYWNRIANAGVAQARVNEFNVVPKKVTFYNELCDSLRAFGKHWPDGFLDGLPDGVRSRYYGTRTRTRTKPEQEQEPEQEPEPEPKDKTLQRRNDKKSGVNGSVKTSALWSAYSDAYHQRYGTDPVRNAAVNSQLSRFVDRVGCDDAPHVARYYLSLGNRWYIEKCHSVSAMLNDAEGLRTQWITGQRVSSTTARHADRSEHNANVVSQLIAEQERKNGEH